MTTRLEEFFDPTGPYDVLISDHLSDDFNTGFMGFKATPRALAFLKRLAAMQLRCHSWATIDQGAYNFVMLDLLHERLCLGDDRVLPPGHPACKFRINDCVSHCGNGYTLYDCFRTFRALLPVGLWSYGNRSIFPWLKAYKYTGDDPHSPLVDFNRFFAHIASYDPLSQPSDFITHAKNDQGPYLRLIAEISNISAQRKARGLGKTFCEALTLMRP